MRRLTGLDARFLTLVHSELLELLLVAIAELAQVSIGDAATE